MSKYFWGWKKNKKKNEINLNLDREESLKIYFDFSQKDLFFFSKHWLYLKVRKLFFRLRNKFTQKQKKKFTKDFLILCREIDKKEEQKRKKLKMSELRILLN